MPSLSFVTSQSQHQEVLSKGMWKSSLPHSITLSRLPKSPAFTTGKTSSNLHWSQERSPWLHLKLHQSPSAFYRKVQTFWWQSMALRQWVSFTKTKERSFTWTPARKAKLPQTRGFANLIDQESVFNVTIAMPEEGQYASTNPQQPSCTWRDSSQRGSLRGRWDTNSVLCPP